MRVAIYIRVSTKLQETRYSLSAQKTELSDYAKRQGWEVIGLYKDVESGGKLNKKGLNELLDVVEEGKVDVVLCIDQDRLSRLDTIGWEYLKSTLRENNVKIAEPGSMTDLANEDQEFISDIKNLIAKREKKAIVKRMMRGKRQIMREGRGWGVTPLGYTYNKLDKKYELDEEWAWVIPFIDDLYLNKQYGITTIANELNKISKTPSGRDWNETLVYRRLISKAFHGIMEKKFSNGEVIAVEGIYPTLRTKETWDKIMEEKSKRAVKYFKVDRRTSKEKLHILRRTSFVCGLCGYKISLAQSGKKEKPTYYLRHGRRKRYRDKSECKIAINTSRLERNLIESIKKIASSEEEAKKYIDFTADEDDIKSLEKTIYQYKKRSSDIKTKIDKLIDLYLDGVFSKEQIQAKQLKMEAELETIVKQQDQMETKLKTIKSNQFNYEMVFDLFESIQNFEKEFTALEQAQIVGRLFPTATLYEDHLMMHMELEQGFPIDVRIKIDPDPHTWHHTKKG